jgi:uncharacterized protein
MSISLIIMQPTSFCNLDCSYCYVPDRAVKGSMSDETLKQFFRVLFNSDLAESCRIVWHAGEPLVSGRGFYEKMFAIQHLCNTSKKPISHWIQTNGTLIDESWCAFFKEKGIRISISMDGPEFLHDSHRVDRAGNGSFQKVLRAINLLKHWEVPYQVLSVITRDALNYPEEYFAFFLDNGIAQVAFNIEELNVQKKRSSMVSERGSTDGDEISRKYKTFVAKLFDLWKHHYQSINIRELSQMYHIVNEKSKNPAFRRVSEEHFGLEILNVKKNGDVSTFAPELIEGNDGNPDTFVLGNVHQLRSFTDLMQTPKYSVIEAEVMSGIEKCKNTCAYFDFCGGGHLSAKYFENGTFDCTETEYCKLHRQALVEAVLDNLSNHTL